MDMLYRAYSNPLDLIRIYINQGKFGTFVEEFIKIEAEKIKEERERDTDNKLWLAYLLSGEKLSFAAYKQQIIGSNGDNKTAGGDENLDDEGIKGIINNLFSKNQPHTQGGE